MMDIRIDRFQLQDDELEFLTAPAELGGAGSGNKGHAGIPGHRGGSQPTGTQEQVPEMETIQKRMRKALRFKDEDEAKQYGTSEEGLYPSGGESLMVNPNEVISVYEQAALKDYKDNMKMARAINGRLRLSDAEFKKEFGDEWNLAELDDHIAKMDSAFAKTDVPQDMFVYRGLKAHNLPSDLKVGDEFVDKGYMSTTLSEKRFRVAWFAPGAHNYQGLEDYAGDRKGLVMFIPKGSHALYLDNAYLRPEFNENEVLLPRGQRWVVTAIRSNEDIVVMPKGTGA